MESWEKRINKVLGKDCEVNPNNSVRFKNHLLKELKFPLKVTSIEDFFWEEPYILGGWDKKEYDRLKKTNPSYMDIFELLDIEDPNEYDDLMGKIKRESDGKIFLWGLSFLRTVDKKSPSYHVLNDYSIWHCNY